MLSRRRSLKLLLAAAAAATPLARVQRLHAQEAVRFVRIGTGPIGGTYFPVGGLIASVISAPAGAMPCALGGSCGVPGLIAAAVSTQGSVDNVQSMAAGSLDLALCQADVANDAYTGAGVFADKPPLAMLRSIAHLFQEAVHILVRADDHIADVKQLKGRRVSVGEKNSGTFATATAVLRGFDLKVKQLKAVYEKLPRSVELLTTGEIDALFMVGGPPVSAISYAAEQAKLTLLAIPPAAAKRIIADQRRFVSTVIPADTYAGVPATETLGIGAQLLVTTAMEETLAYEITRALWAPQNRRVLDSGIPSGRQIRLETALAGLSVPLHPGARRYYIELGLSVPNEP